MVGEKNGWLEEGRSRAGAKGWLGQAVGGLLGERARCRRTGWVGRKQQGWVRARLG